MSHPLILASLKYMQAQAKVLHEAETFESRDGADAKSLLEAVRKMKEAKAAYTSEKSAAMAETPE